MCDSGQKHPTHQLLAKLQKAVVSRKWLVARK
jgi:hypothetical protein